MPKIPIVTATGERVVHAGSPGVVRLPAPQAESYGAGIGQGLTQFGSALMQTANKLQEQQDELELSRLASDFDVASAEKYREILQDDSLTGESVLETARAKANALQRWASDYRRELISGEGAVSQAMMKHENRRAAELSIQMQADTLHQIAERQKDELPHAMQRAADEAAGAVTPKYEQEKIAEITALGERALANKVLPPHYIHAQVAAAKDRYWSQVAINQPDRIKAIQRGVEREAKDIPADMDAAKLVHYGQLANLTLAARHAEQMELLRAQQQAVKDAQDRTRQVFVEKWQDGSLSADEILRSDLPAVGDGSKEHYIKLIEAKAREGQHAEKFVKDPGLKASVMANIRRGHYKTMDEVDAVYYESARRGQGIDYEDAKQLEKEFEEMRAPGGQSLLKRKQDLFDGVKPSIDKSVFGQKTDPEGSMLFLEYQQWVDEQVAQAREQGKDPNALFDRANKELYVGRPEIVRRFQRSMMDEIRDMSKRLERKDRVPITPETQRRDGESYSDYRKRMGK